MREDDIKLDGNELSEEVTPTQEEQVSDELLQEPEEIYDIWEEVESEAGIDSEEEEPENFNEENDAEFAEADEESEDSEDINDTYDEEKIAVIESVEEVEPEQRTKKGRKNGRKRDFGKNVAGKTADVLKSNKAVMKFTGSIKFKLIGAFIIPVALIIFLGVVSYLTASNAIKNSYTDASQSTINKTAAYYNLMFSNVKATATDLVNNSTMQEYYSGTYSSDSVNEANNYNTLKSNLSSTALSNKAIANIYIIGSYGKAMYTSSSKLSETGMYESVKNSEEGKIIDSDRAAWFTSREYFDTQANTRYAVSYARQLIGTSKKGIGYMFFDLDLDYVTDPLSDIDLGSKSIIALIAPDDGEIVVSNYIDIEDGKKYFTDQSFYEKIQNAEESNGNYYVTYNGKKQLLFYSKTDDGFVVCALIPQSVIFAQAWAIGVVTIIIVIIALVIALLVGGYISMNISSTIYTMMDKLKLAASGDFTVHVNVKNKDEFGILADAINSMIDNVKQLIEKTKNVSERVDGSVEMVSDSARQLLDETKEITTAIEAIEQGVVQQAQDSEDCLRQMDNLSEKINVVSENSDKIAMIADQTTEIVESGIDSIEELKRHAGSTVTITHQVIEEILELQESSKSIGNIVAAINEIAEQTNLLSLNASIEAARAGEAGRGFSVVAAEIRKLAEQSVESANEITRIIENINNKTSDTVSIARKAEDVVEVQGESLENATRVFEDIQSKFAELLSNLGNITGGIETIGDAKTLTIDAIQSISAVSQETAASSEEVTETANRQLTAVEELNGAAEDLLSNAARLSEAIDLFKI
jgi:methyl-accepting chemotaxis protein